MKNEILVGDTSDAKSQEAIPTQNVRSLVVSMTAAIPVPVMQSKTRQRLTVADQKQKEQLTGDLLEAEMALLNAHDGFLAGSDEWDEVQRLDADYRKVIDKANNFICEIHSDQEDYFSERTEKWQDSERGRDYQSWMGEWEVEISSDDLPEPGDGGDLELNASDMLQELPDEPSM